MRQSCLHYPLVLRTLCVSRAAMVHVAPGSRSPFWSQNQRSYDTTPVQTGSSHPTRKSSSAVQSSCVCVSQVLKAALKAACIRSRRIVYVQCPMFRQRNDSEA